MAHLPFCPGVVTLGDPHLGKTFTTGVPLHRRGEREALQWLDFERSLTELPAGTHTHVCMGDLFDRSIVPNSVVLRAARLYQQAARANPDVNYYILQGNHDESRDKEVVSSFEIFANLLIEERNVLAVQTPMLVRPAGQHLELALFPWRPFQTAEEVVAELKPRLTHPYVAFGHWDILAFGEMADNTIPILSFDPALCKGVVTGHYHLPTQYMNNGIPIVVTGSMQPYSHAEDVNGRLYVTLPLAEVERQLAVNPEVYADKNVRVEIGESEQPCNEFNCLSLTFKRLGSQTDDPGLNVDADSFDLKGIFHKSMFDAGVSPALTELLWNKV